MAPTWSDGGRSSRESGTSNQTRSTAPTQYDLPSRPSLQHQDSGFATILDRTASPSCSSFDPKASTSTYASTIPSDEDLDPEDPEYDVLPEDEPQYRHQLAEPTVVASTPPEFAELFPSTKRLQIQHDDSTLDGNMNLRVDCPIPGSHGRQQNVTLFHLRMHDLKSRQFSLRRYCRDSGREVCHSEKVIKKASPTRPALQRSVSSVISSIRGYKPDSKLPNSPSGLRRHDSGYDSGEWEEDTADHSIASKNEAGRPTNITKLDFSNYARVDVKRLGSGSSKRYEFEYWGTSYCWKRQASKDTSGSQPSYHLVDTKSGIAVAHIVPDALTSEEAADEQSKGGWISPSVFWISDPSILSGLTDVADVIVSTGLVALVDDSIARRFHHKRTVHITVPVPSKSPLKINMEYIGPKKLIDEVFSRRNSASSNSPASARHPTPLRQISAEA
ncbi:MAG: hypothetical protein M1814_000444 [Vezdaea aestivalis]|nr:MAG: hypothetical protein M1814_000444 [Vezdaea aestivalis]